MRAPIWTQRARTALLAGVLGALIGPSFALAAGPAITPTVSYFKTGISNNAGPYEITAGPDGNSWFTEVDTNDPAGRIGQITATGAISEFPAGREPNSIITGPDGNLWFTETGGNLFCPQGGSICGAPSPTPAVAELSPSAPTVVHRYTSGLPTSATPWGIAVGSDHNIWFTDDADNEIGRLTADTHVFHLFGGLTAKSASNKHGPTGITSGPDGALWFTERDQNKIGRITTGGTVTEYNVPTASSNPDRIAVGADRNLYFTEEAGNKIGRLNPATHSFKEFPLAGQRPTGIGLGSDGAIWFTEEYGFGPDNKGVIGRLTTDGLVNEFALNDPLSPNNAFASGGQVGPFEIAVGSDGSMWFTEINYGHIGRITAPPAVVTAAASTAGSTAEVVRGTVDGHAQPTTFRVDYGKTTSYGSSTSSTAVSATGAKPISVLLKGLHPSTTYHYRVVATNSTGPTFGVDRTFTTAHRPTLSLSHVKPRSKGVSVLIRCRAQNPDSCAGRLTLVVAGHKHPPTVPSLGMLLKARSGGVTLGHASFHISAGKKHTVRVRLNAQGKALLLRLLRLRVRIIAKLPHEAPLRSKAVTIRA